MSELKDLIAKYFVWKQLLLMYLTCDGLVVSAYVVVVCVVWDKAAPDRNTIPQEAVQFILNICYLIF